MAGLFQKQDSSYYSNSQCLKLLFDEKTNTNSVTVAPLGCPACFMHISKGKSQVTYHTSTVKISCKKSSKDRPTYRPGRYMGFVDISVSAKAGR